MPRSLPDPADLTAACLERLPADPADAGAEDLKLITATVHGLDAHAAIVAAAQERLAALIAAGGIDSEHALAEVDWLGALMRRNVHAARVLKNYARIAITAMGFDHDALVECVANPTSKEHNPDAPHR